MSDFKANMHQIRFRLGLRPRPRSESLQRSPRPLPGFMGPTSKGREGMKKEKGEKVGEREGKGRDGRGICLLLNLGLATPLHALPGSWN